MLTKNKSPEKKFQSEIPHCNQTTEHINSDEVLAKKKKKKAEIGMQKEEKPLTTLLTSEWYCY